MSKSGHLDSQRLGGGNQTFQCFSVVRGEEDDLKFHIWDTESQDALRSTDLYFKGWHGVLLVYDVTKQESFENLDKWVEIIREYLSDARILLVGNKTDLQHLKTVWTEDGQAYADSKGLDFYETSALDWSNIKDAFEELLQKVVDSNNTMK